LVILHRLVSPATLVVALSGALFVARLGGAGASWLPSAGALAALYAVLALSARIPDDRFTRRSIQEFAGRHGFAIALAIVVVLYFAIRLPGLNAELGHAPLDIDEQRLAENVRHFFTTGELVHEQIEQYPGAVFWLFAGAAFTGYTRLLSAGRAIPPDLLPVERFVAWARVANIGVGVGIVVFTGLIGRRVFGARAGIMAAALVAIAPLSIAATLVVRNDAGMVLAVLAAVYCALIALDDQRMRWMVLGGAAAGLAAAIKYSSVFAIVPVVAAACVTRGSRNRVAAALAACGAFVAAIAISNHFVWADFPNFLRQLSDQAAITGAGRWSATANPAALYVRVLAGTTGAGIVLFAAAVCFIVYALARPRARTLIFLSFPVLYMWFMTNRPSQFARWVFPLLPFVAVAGSGAIIEVVRLLLKPRPAAGTTTRFQRAAPMIAFAAVVAVAVAQPLAGAVTDVSRRLATPTHTLVERWLAAHVKSAEPVLTEDGWLDLRSLPSPVRRVPDLGALLNGGTAACDGAVWVVVPETVFGHPTLSRLIFVQRFHAGQGFGGNTGYDYEIYRVPGASPAQ
jgi:4-amino-4-deoxy-L-arabinose transferase-like glycosyltransferase